MAKKCLCHACECTGVSAAPARAPGHFSRLPRYAYTPEAAVSAHESAAQLCERALHLYHVLVQTKSVYAGQHRSCARPHVVWHYPRHAPWSSPREGDEVSAMQADTRPHAAQSASAARVSRNRHHRLQPQTRRPKSVGITDTPHRQTASTDCSITNEDAWQDTRVDDADFVCGHSDAISASWTALRRCAERARRQEMAKLARLRALSMQLYNEDEDDDDNEYDGSHGNMNAVRTTSLRSCAHGSSSSWSALPASTMTCLCVSHPSTSCMVVQDDTEHRSDAESAMQRNDSWRKNLQRVTPPSRPPNGVSTDACANVGESCIHEDYARWRAQLESYLRGSTS